MDVDSQACLCPCTGSAHDNAQESVAPLIGPVAVRRTEAAAHGSAWTMDALSSLQKALHSSPKHIAQTPSAWIMQAGA
jgi:hypothetical protein